VRFLPNKIDVTDILGKAFVEYSAAVNFHRAFPDCRDGLKPVQRCILFAMHKMGLVGVSNKTMTKVQAVAAEVSGKYHPHGDSAAADALYKLGQDWVMRYPLVIAEGNFGSPDEAPSAPRYPETALSAVGKYVVGKDLSVCHHRPNYNNQYQIPIYMPSPFPNLLCNGQQGIGSAMAFQSISHNLGEVVDVIKSVAKNPKITVDQILKLMPGPDLPTGGIIFQKNTSEIDGIRSYYETGKGTIIVRGKIHKVCDDKPGSIKLVVTEVPYGVGPEQFVEDINKHRDEFEDIAQVINLSSNTTCIEISLNKNADVDNVIERLYQRTRLQINFSINNTFIDRDENTQSIHPMSIRDMVDVYIRHRLSVILSRSKVRASLIDERIHVLDGLLVALNNIVDVVNIITNSSNVSSAQKNLKKHIKISTLQADAILAMQLQVFTKLSSKKLRDELKKLQEEKRELDLLITDKNIRITTLCRELDEIVTTCGDARRTTIINSAPQAVHEDQTMTDQLVITISNRYIKKSPAFDVTINKVTGTPTLTREQALQHDHFLCASPDDRIGIVDSTGQLYAFDASEVPLCSINDQGVMLSDVCSLPSENLIAGLIILPISKSDTNFLLTISDQGFVKKTSMNNFVNRRPSGMRAVSPKKEEKIIFAAITDGNSTITMVSNKNKVCKISESGINSQGVNARGVRGIKLNVEATLCGCGITPFDILTDSIVVATAHGDFCRYDVNEVKETSRGTQGSKIFSSIKTDDYIISAAIVSYEQMIKYHTDKNKTGLIDPSVIKLSKKDKVISSKQKIYISKITSLNIS